MVRRFCLGILIVSIVGGPVATGSDVRTEKLNKVIEASLAREDGSTVPLKDLAGTKATVVFFLSFDCPNSNNYTPTMLQLVRDYADRGVRFVGIVEGDLTAEQLRDKVKEFKIPFPLFLDPNLALADAFKAVITPEAFVLDHNRVLRYRGRIDNMFAARLKRVNVVTDHDLKDALDDVLAGKPVRKPVTEAVGCPIGSRELPIKKASRVTYHRDVAPILQKHCQGCHRPGEVGPFSLLTYKQAVHWAEDIKAYTSSRQMPPWKVTRSDFEFHNDRRLTEAEIAILAEWVDGGAPEGDPKDAPKPVAFTDGWMLGKPDLILTPSEDFHLGPSGPDAFRCLVIPTNLPEDKYIIGYEVKPGNPRVVHHTLNFWDLSGRARKLEEEARKKASASDRDRGPGYSSAMGVGFLPGPSPRKDVPSFGGFGGWAPGQLPRFLPQDTGYLLPKGADVVIQMHYHRNGKDESDRTQIGLYFAPKPVKYPFQTIVVGPRMPFLINIPPGKADHKIDGFVYIHTDSTLHSVLPHMHLLGKSVKVTMTPPGGQTQTLVEISKWDYNWQETYWLKEPLPIKAGTRFDIEAIFDNSADNPNNPNQPPVLVRFGEQTTDEMLFGFFGMTSPQTIVARNTPPRAK